MSLEPRIYLASRSPRRRELLHQVHVNFEVLLFRAAPREDADVDETPLAGEQPEDYAVRVAVAKAQAGVGRVRLRHLPFFPVLSADTTIDLDGDIIGKPLDDDDAMRILSRFSGRVHKVITAISMADEHRQEHLLSVNEVRMPVLSEEEIRRYVRSGESRDKAGAYGIQGRAATFVEEIRGSFSGIMGLPLFETAQLLRRFGYPI